MQGEHLRAPQRSALADGEDPTIGRALLVYPPVAPQVGRLNALGRQRSLSRNQDLIGLGTKLRRYARVTLRRRPESRAICLISPLHIENAPGHRVMLAEIVSRCHHCVILVSLTVSDAADFCMRHRLNPRPTGQAEGSALLVPLSVPYAGAVPDGGLIRLRRPRPSAPPSSSGLGHRPFKAAARVRIPLGAHAGYGCQHEVL